MLGSKKATKQQADSLLTLRIINSLPLVSTAKQYYQQTKNSNNYLKSGLNYAEGSLLSAGAPLISRYSKVDNFFAKRVEQLEETYRFDGPVAALTQGSVMSLQLMTLPVSYSFSLAQKMSNKAWGMASSGVNTIFSAADDVVDGLLPADASEKTAELKNPVSRIRSRTNMRSIRALPFNTLGYSFRTAKNLSFRSADYASTFALKAMFGQIEKTLHMLERFETLTGFSKPLLSYYQSTQFAQLVLTQKAGLLVNDLLLAIFERADLVQKALHDQKLPKSALLLEKLSNDLQRVASYFGFAPEKDLLNKLSPLPSSPSSSSKPKKFATKLFPAKQARVQLQDPTKKPTLKPFLGDQRMPTFFAGEDELERVDKKESERTPSLMAAAAPKPKVDTPPTKLNKNVVNMATLHRALSRNLLSPKIKGCPATPANSPANYLTASRHGSIVAIADQSDQPITAEVVVEKGQGDAINASTDSFSNSGSGATSPNPAAQWEQPKHPIHIHEEKQANGMQKNEIPEIVLNQNNPFAALRSSGGASV